ncbi:MAG: isoprenyl transferase [Lewinellaceae bacterium]|nr:isoprenyl transferase [Saprospiraceae bacterium]MCB9271084.1 isoprenyl transferase [Lewinellaceae bacterium]HPQ99411.1 isoprenyl transferase [Saprospiraceae bacterium]HQU52075.1 isoprenyl transferase [Saprospiraceae bacterium]
MDYKSLIIPEKLPQHVAIIMDGNGRWAKQHSKPRVFGHRNGVKAVRETTEAAAELGIKYLTLYAFSTENWNRPQLEVNALLHLLVETLSKEIHTLMENNIRLTAIGDLAALPDHTRRALLEGIEKTKANTRMTLVLALNYSGRWDIVQAARNIARSVQEGKLDPDQIDEKHFQEYLATREIPDPEFMIRTSGEQRTSNFLCYQLAYAELYFTTVLWPDFRKEHLYQAIVAYQQRERRFGMISEQLA